MEGTNPHHPNVGHRQEVVGQVDVDQFTERVEHRETEYYEGRHQVDLMIEPLGEMFIECSQYQVEY